MSQLSGVVLTHPKTLLENRFARKTLNADVVAQAKKENQLMTSSPVPAAPDSISTTAANAKSEKSVQLKKYWSTAAADTQFDPAKLPDLCLALQNRGAGNHSRLEYVLKSEGAFADPHSRVCTLAFLLHDYASRRSGSAVANEKWGKARRHLLALRKELPAVLQNAPLFTKLEGQTEARPRRRRDANWRDR